MEFIKKFSEAKSLEQQRNLIKSKVIHNIYNLNNHIGESYSRNKSSDR